MFVKVLAILLCAFVIFVFKCLYSLYIVCMFNILILCTIWTTWFEESFMSKYECLRVDLSLTFLLFLSSSSAYFSFSFSDFFFFFFSSLCAAPTRGQSGHHSNWSRVRIRRARSLHFHPPWAPASGVYPGVCPRSLKNDTQSHQESVQNWRFFFVHEQT